MIYYYSGTGNSQWAADTLARLTGDKAVSIPSLMKSDNAKIHISDGETVCLVFPIYAWAPPEQVLQFVSGLTCDSHVFRCAVCTCGDEAGNAMQRLQKAFPLDSAWSVAMPNNYIIGFDVDPSNIARAKVREAAERLPVIAGDIQARRKVWEVSRGRLPELKTALVAPLFNRFARSTKPFHVFESCISCGLCASGCPSANITILGGKPHWDKDCQMCLSCINRCPTRAIQYGSSTQKKGRYCFTDKMLSD